MTEDEAKAWLAAHVSRETFARLEEFVSLVQEEARRHNLIAPSTMDSIWARHVVDSAQLLKSAGRSRRWLDLGSGAGFPGMVIAILSDGREIVLAESRYLRVTFLREVIARLGLEGRATVASGRVETLRAKPFDIISARAFAPLDRLFSAGLHLSSQNTLWLLPKGKSAQEELDAVRGTWQGDFRIEPSVTDPDAAIIIAGRISRRGDGRKARSVG